MKNLSDHTDLCELVTLLPIKGIQMGGMSQLGRLIPAYPLTVFIGMLG
jgi:hypothetical protein